MADPVLVRAAVERSVLTLTLDSPANRNALSRLMVEQLRESLAEGDRSAEVRLVVLTSAGTTFCSGADLTEAVTGGMEQGTRRLLGLLRAVVALSKPVIAVVRGPVRAGGVGLVGACDLALASDDATFAFTEARLGLAPAIISLTTRHRLRSADASFLYLTGAVFDGRAAASYGLVTESRPADELDARLDELVAAFGAVSPQGLRETKRLLAQPVLAAVERNGDRLVELSARLFGSDEAHEGMRAFRARRRPHWDLSAD